MDMLSRKLVSAMQCGFMITFRDGHRWIDFEPVTDLAEEIEKVMVKKGVEISSKVYGGYEEALDRISGVLEMLGFDRLENMYIDDGN